MCEEEPQARTLTQIILLDAGRRGAESGHSLEGFGWGLVGLDVDNIDPQFSSGTTHVVILPPDLAYGDRDGHQYQDTWMRFELTLGRLLPA